MRLANAKPFKHARLQTRVDLIRDVAVCPGVPGLTDITRHLRERELLNVGWALEDVDVQACGYVPRDVAVHGPHTGVVLLELKHDVSRNS